MTENNRKPESSLDVIQNGSGGSIEEIDKYLEKDENMLPVHFLPEGKKCYDWINHDIENSSTNQSEKKKLTNKITYSQANMNIGDNFKNNMINDLLSAAENGNLQVLVDILEKSPHIVNLTDRDGYTALHRACYSGHLNIAEALLERKANIHSKTNDGWQPIHCASRWNHVDVASYLLSKNADVNSRTNGNQTPLHFAALTEDNMKLLEMLLLHPNIDVNIANGAGDMAYDLASRNGPQVKLFEMRDEAMKI